MSAGRALGRAAVSAADASRNGSSWLRRLRVAGAAAVCAVMAACTLPKHADEVGEGVYARAGRFALRVDAATGKQDAVQGGFTWRDDGRALRLDLANPLGTILARVEASQRGAVLTRSDGSQTAAADPDSLVAEVLGRSIPVSGLRDWLRGRVADPRAANVQRDGEGRPEHFVQDGWQVRLSRYDEQGPRLLRLERRQAGDLIDVRLVID